MITARPLLPLLLMMMMFGTTAAQQYPTTNETAGASSPGATSRATAKATPQPDAARQLNRLFEDYFERSLQLNPLQATFIGDHRYDDRLTNDISPAHIAAALAVDRQYLDAVLEFDPKSLSPHRF